MNNYSNPVTVTGNPASFEASGSGKLLSLSVPFSPIQSGSGTPSPDNVRPISGRTGLSVYVSPTQDVADATTYAIDWTSQAGTVYGGTLDVVTGVLTVDRAKTTLDGNLSESNIAVASYNDYTRVTYSPYSSIGKPLAGFVCDTLSDNGTIAGLYKIWHSANADAARMFLGLPLTVTTRAEAVAWFASNSTTVVYELATPLTYQLTPTQVELLIGQNNVWSDSNEAVTLTYVIELFTRYTFIVNGNDYTGLVERDSYRTAVTPVYGETIQTLDGVGHTALLRVKGSLTVKLNPQTAAQTAAICADLLNAPCEVQYKCLQRNVNVTALMVLDAVSAMFLSRCLYLGQKWNDVDEIVLKEL